MMPEVLATGWVNRTDSDKTPPARLSPPPHTFDLLNSNHYAMNPLPLKNVNSQVTVFLPSNFQAASGSYL